MNVANYQITLPKQTTLVCTKQDCGVTVTPAQMSTSNTSSSSAAATSSCYLNCTCSGTSGSKCNYNVTLVETGHQYYPSPTLGTNKEFTTQLNLTSATGCSVQNTSTTETSVMNTRDKIVANCSLTVPAGGSVNANIRADFKFYNPNINQASQSGKVYKYELTAGSLVPSGYTQVEYVQSTGSQYINTTLVPATDFSYFIKWRDDIINGSNYVFASRVAAGETLYQGITGAVATQVISVLKHSTATTSNFRQAGYIYESYASYNASTTGVSYLKCLTTGDTWTGTQSSESSGATAPIYVFAVNSSQIHSGISVYILKLWNNGILERNLIPAVRNSDSKPGLYDTVHDVFYPSNSSSNFVAGPAV